MTIPGPARLIATSDALSGGINGARRKPSASALEQRHEQRQQVVLVVEGPRAQLVLITAASTNRSRLHREKLSARGAHKSTSRGERTNLSLGFELELCDGPIQSRVRLL
jgi:hypothetical protein